MDRPAQPGAARPAHLTQWAAVLSIAPPPIGSLTQVEDLPSYLEEPAEDPFAGRHRLTRELLVRAALLIAPPDTHQTPPPPPPAFAGSGITSAAFFRMMQVPGPLLPVAFEHWWRQRSA